MNEVLRREYREDSQRGLDRFNRALAAAGVGFRLALPSPRFHRQQGIYAGRHFDPQGRPISPEEWQAQRDVWLPSESDRAYVASLMAKPVFEPGKVANWIAPPRAGIKGRPPDYAYVRLD
jgi:benzoyl-CoA 2,3-dioxygenase component B